MTELTDRQALVLVHTSNTGRYVTTEPDVIKMAKDGLLYNYGPQMLAGGAHYLVTTPKGRAALSEWRAQQPKPKQKRRSRVFEAWRLFCEAREPVKFGYFAKHIWPHRNDYE